MPPLQPHCQIAPGASRAAARAGRLALGILWGITAVAAARAQTRTVPVAVDCFSIQMLPTHPVFVTGTGNLSTYFSTYNGITGAFLVDTRNGGSVVSGQVGPNGGGDYASGYAHATSSALVEEGYQIVRMPGADTDRNSIPDVLQLDFDGNFTATGYLQPRFRGFDGLYGTSIQFIRSAGSPTGTYRFTIPSQNVTLNGEFNLVAYRGTMQYTRGETNTLSVSITRVGPEPITLTGATTFTTTDASRLTYAAFALRDGAGAVYQVRGGTFSRNGASYGGVLILEDGLLATSWADFQTYSVSFTDTNDADRNGIPDLTDPNVVFAAPQFVAQPGSVVVTRGSTVAFSAEAAGMPAPTLQWRKNGVVIAGATASTLVLTAVTAANAGSYACTATNVRGVVTSAAGTLTVLESTTNPGKLINLSIRTTAGTGTDTLITGFAIGGAGTTGFKPVLVRGVGPSLGQFGVADALGDPSITLFSGTRAMAANNDWAGDAQIKGVAAEVGAFALVSDASKDAALFTSAMAAGSYTAQITGAAGQTGTALAEIYDATPAAIFNNTTPRLVNVSARARVGTGGNVLIAGFVVGGSTAQTLLIRGVGPTLGTFGVSGTLSDPKLELYAGNQLTASNDDWVNTPEIVSTTTNVGAFALNSTRKDAVILITLAPGAYSAQMSGVGGATGVGLIEVYEVPRN